MTGTFVIQVWHQDTSGNETYADYFDSMSNACAYAYANRNKIAYGLPRVVKIWHIYDAKKETVTHEIEEVTPERIELTALNEISRREWR